MISFVWVKIKGSVWDSKWTPEFDIKHLKKAEGHISLNVVIITKKWIPKVNVIARLEIELAYYDVEGQYISISSQNLPQQFQLNK